MNTWKQRLFTNWHAVRIMRLGLGIMMIIMGIQSKDWAIGMFSAFFLYQAVTNTGCCGTQECYTPEKNTGNLPKEKETIIDYEEIK